MSVRYLITGAQGFAGRALAGAALDAGGVTVLGIGRSEDRRLFANDRRFAYAPIDVRDCRRLSETIRAFAPTVVFHLASGLRGDAAAALFDTNVGGTLSLMEAIARSGVSPRVVLASSGGVYGRLGAAPFREDDACVPVDLYAASKLAQEHVATIAGAETGIRVVVGRLFNLVGAGIDERHACARFAQQLVRVAERGDAQPVEIGDLSATRDFIDVRDAAAALLALSRPDARERIYNVASGRETALSELYALTCDAAGLSSPPPAVRTYRHGADVPRHVGDISKLRALGYRARYTLRESVRDFVSSYRCAARRPNERTTSEECVSSDTTMQRSSARPTSMR